MTVGRNNRTLRCQVFGPISTVHSTTGARTRGSAFGSNEAEARARGTAGVVGARESRFGHEIVDIGRAVAVEGDKARDWRDRVG